MIILIIIIIIIIIIRVIIKTIIIIIIRLIIISKQITNILTNTIDTDSQGKYTKISPNSPARKSPGNAPFLQTLAESSKPEN